MGDSKQRKISETPDEILEQSQTQTPQGGGFKYGDIGKILQTASTLSKMTQAFKKDSKEVQVNQIEVKNVTESYLIEQIIALTEFCYTFESFQRELKVAESEKQRQQIEESRDGQLKDLIKRLTDENCMEFLQHGNYEIEVLQDLLDIALVIFEEYMLIDQFQYGESPLFNLFNFLQQLTLLSEAQFLLLNSKTFYELSSKFTKKTVKEDVFWQRELAFITTISNIVSHNEIIDFTGIQFLQYAEILIQFYDFIRKDHSEVKKRLEKTKRKDIDRTPPLMFDQGQSQILSHLALLPAYLVEFSASSKYNLGQKFDAVQKQKNLTSVEILQKQYTMISILCRMCLDSIEKNELSKYLKDIVDKMSDMVFNTCSVIKRMILAFFKLYVKTNDMRCWLKFSSPYLAIDATNNIKNICIIGNPHYFGEEIGLYQKWGAFFDEGDMLYLKDHIKLDSQSQIRSYTISLWFIYPFRTLSEYLNPTEATFIDIATNSQTPVNRIRKPTKNFRTFIQCESGNGCILGIQNESKIVFFDDEFRMHTFDLINKNEGWNNIILVVDNVIQNVKIYINRKEIANKFNVTISRNVAFVGNCMQKNEPCGTICDLRFFESIIPEELIEKIVHYNRIQNMPDFLHYDLDRYQVCQTIEQLFDKNKKDDKILIDMIKCILALSTNQYTKGVLISRGIFNKIVPLTFHKNYEIRVTSQKALLYFY